MYEILQAQLFFINNLEVYVLIDKYLSILNYKLKR